MGALLVSVHIFILSVFASLKFMASAQDQFIYNGFQGANLSLSGIAKIHPNGLLELTNTSYQKFGHAFFPLPVKFKSSSSSNFPSSLSFSTNFVFAMVPELPTHGGHGIAFAISPSMLLLGAKPTQYLGLLNSTNDGLSSNHLLAIELDSANSPDLEDIDANHIGIDINSLKSIDSAPVTYFLSKERRNQSLELISGNPMQVWVDYKEEEELVNVTVAPLGVSKPNRPLLSRSLNISQVLLESMYVGFSAATGSVSSRHYILGWSFNKSGEAQNLDPSKLPSLPSFGKSKKVNLHLIIGLAVILMAVFVVISVFGTIFIRRKRCEEIREDWEQQYGPQRFSYRVLYKATKGFRDKDLLGSGGFGKVYRGLLPCNTQIAVKKISHNSTQGMKEFVAEIATMGRLRHRNLVQLLGYCRRKGELLLVYEYMPNGSLDKLLFSNKETNNLNWDQRYRIIRGVASGLFYLHHEWEQVVLHRDVKASNVLLDANFNARLGDFGLAKFYDHGANPQTTLVVGTVGYIAPELTKTGKPTTSSDVFAFGNFMLEIACGRKPFEPLCLPEDMILADWVLECCKRGDILSTSDPRLEGNYVVEEMELVLKLGLLCAHSTPAARPSMRQVASYLDGNVSLPEVSQDGGGGSITSSYNDVFDSVNSWSSNDSILIYGR